MQIALAANPSGTVAYYAHLFAGRAAQAMGQTHDAASLPGRGGPVSRRAIGAPGIEPAGFARR